MPGQGTERGKLAAHDELRDRLRAEYPGMRITYGPGGWCADEPRTDRYIIGPTLEELAVKLEAGQ